MVSMLRTSGDILEFAVETTDGTVGHVKDLYFDDQTWVIRYFVVHTGPWLIGRKVLISPISAGRPDWSGHLLPITITKDQLRSSPLIDTDRPVSRQHEAQLHDFYRYPYYWQGNDIWGTGLYPAQMVTGIGFGDADSEIRLRAVQTSRAAHQHHSGAPADPNLRSCNAVSGYRVGANDGEIGHVTGLLVEEDTWAVRYMVVDTSNWWLNHQVLVAPQWIKDVRWAERLVSVDLSRKALKDSPPYTTGELLSRSAESRLFLHYGRPNYWQPGSKVVTSGRGAP
jgi:hypothetical protein